jgi:Protein of unknown function (DUF3292)
MVPGGLDLNIADEDEFSPDKLRSTIERLYMTVVSDLNFLSLMNCSSLDWLALRNISVVCVPGMNGSVQHVFVRFDKLMSELMNRLTSLHGLWIFLLLCSL